MRRGILCTEAEKGPRTTTTREAAALLVEIWMALVKSELKLQPSHSHLMLCVPDGWSKAQLKPIMDELFSVYGVLSCHLIPVLSNPSSSLFIKLIPNNLIKSICVFACLFSLR